MEQNDGPDAELVGWLRTEIERLAPRAITTTAKRELAFKRRLLDASVRSLPEADSSSPGLAREVLTMLGDLFLEARAAQSDRAGRWTPRPRG